MPSPVQYPTGPCRASPRALPTAPTQAHGPISCRASPAEPGTTHGPGCPKPIGVVAVCRTSPLRAYARRGEQGPAARGGRERRPVGRGGVAEPPELSRLKCAGYHHKGNTSSYALQTEQLLVCRVTSRYNHRFSDRTSIPRTKASPEILQPQFYNTGIVMITNQFKPLLQNQTLVKQLYKP